MSSSSLHGVLTRIAGKRLEVVIRAEDSRRIWERRVPLTPEAVYKLVSSGRVTVKVVSSSRRVFNDLEYQKAGASIVSSLKETNPNIVLGIKEPPLVEVPLPLSSQHGSTRPPTHLMFSHTAKGQEYNMPLLARFVAPSWASDQTKQHFPRLIDYELLTDENGKRTVGFGWFAGVAGVLESLAAMAQHHLEMGIASPFLHTPRPYTLPTIEKLRESLRHIGSSISQNGTPPELGPFVIGLTGTGQVAQGCLSMLKELPIEMVPVEELENLMTRGADGDLRKIYLVHAKPSDYLVRIDGGKYDREHYYQSPQSYTSLFCDKVAPYLTLFLNGTGWSPSFPRLMTSEQLQTTLTRAKTYGGSRFTNIGDISCDVGGGLEFLPRSTTLTQPTVDVELPEASPSVRMMAVDILPASVPLDASRHFSKALEPYLAALIEEEGSSHAKASATKETPHQAALTRATIASAGVLAPKHSWLQYAVDQADKAAPAPTATSDSNPSSVADSDMNSSDAASPSVAASKPLGFTRRIKKKILMLGSGMVAQPAVDMIALNEGVELVIASNSLLELQSLTGPYLNVKYVVIDVQKPLTYVDLIRDADVVISLLPAPMHPSIAEKCIAAGTHMVTASYISSEMQKLHTSAKSRDVLILNEIGLDPGIDHCSALQLIKGISGAKENPPTEIVSFTSFCGGLPAPEDSHVPLRYKFSWRPQGVLTAALNGARYLLYARNNKVNGKHLLKTYFPNLPITEKFELEGLANRDSGKYMAPYGLDRRGVETFFRGTLRYPGFSSLMDSFSSLGLLNTSDTLVLQSWETFAWQSLALLPEHVSSTSKSRKKSTLPPLESLVALERVQPLLEALEWLGLVRPQMQTGPSDMPPLPKDPMTPLDVFAYLLAHKLKYAPHERDMVVLSNEIITQARVKTEDDDKKATTLPATVHTSTLISYGTKIPNVGFKGERPASAMARTVGIPVALAALFIADGTIQAGGGSFTGVQSPFVPFVYNPILDGLAKVGISFTESTRAVQRATTFGSKVACGTVEDALRMTDRMRFLKFGGVGGGRALERGSMSAPVYDLDSDKRWKEDEVVEWNRKASWR